MTDALTGYHSLPAHGGSHMLPHFVKQHCKMPGTILKANIVQQ